MIDYADIDKLTNTYFDECKQFIQDLVKCSSISGKDAETFVAKRIIKELEKLQLPYKIIANDVNKQNIFVGVDMEKKDGLLLVSHADTASFGDVNKWVYKPLSGEIYQNKLYGRGTMDCKAGIALSIYTIALLKKLGCENYAKALITADEESGADFRFGLKHMLEQGLQASGAIYTYGGNKNEIIIGHRGLLRYHIYVSGESAHSGSLEWQKGERGASAINALRRILDDIMEVSIAGHNQYFPEYRFIQTITMLEGGYGENIVPPLAHALLDVRLLPGQNDKEYLEKVKASCEHAKTEKIRAMLVIKNNQPGAIIDENEKIVQSMRIALEERGLTPVIKGAGLTNEGYMLINAGIPTICTYGIQGENSHAENEFIYLDSISETLGIYIKTAILLTE